MSLSKRVWCVFYTLPKHERKVSSHLRGKNYETYLPTKKIVRQWSDRKKTVVVPLFPNYLFVKSEPEQLYYILSATGIVKVLTEDRQPTIIPEEEIERIRLIANNETEVEVSRWEHELNPTSYVRVNEGPFTGVSGRIIKEKGNYRLLVELKSLHKVLQVNVSAAHLQRISEEEYIS
jgi:transcription antitermination factor NusG